MKERPILFSAPMVKALLAGKKTQTRRVVSPQPEFTQIHEWKGETVYDGEGRAWCWRGHCFGDGPSVQMPELSPYGAPGDRLWVKETFTHITGNGIRTWYRADGEPQDSKGNVIPTEAGLPRWRPSIFMPRHESRVTLEITDVRVQRLQDITEEDAKAEGCEPACSQESWSCLGHDGAPFEMFVEPDADDDVAHFVHVPARQVISARDAFCLLWTQLNGNRKGCAWKDNPWLWCISFKRVTP